MTKRDHATGLESDIAVIGMAGRFPGARSPSELWLNVQGGVESIRRLTDAELRDAGVDEETLRNPHYVKAAAILEDMELFDAGFFGFSPREAAIMDPQHRHFLECSWEALEDAGHVPNNFDGSIGVFGGCGMNAYFMYNILTNPEILRSVGLFLARHTGNDKDFLTTRASYCFNLTGPSISVQTACSTSLVAIHLASQHLLAGECDMALAGGVTIELPHRRGYLYEEGEILSPDGHCRSFDAASKGTVFGSGVGVVVLRRMQDALHDGDSIRAVIKGSAVNNDGASKVGYLAPSVDGQARAILEALAVANVRADTITYVEAHGTGTPVGDPIEVAALTQAFRTHTQKRGYCGIGSLKSNIGHIDTAAGVASFIKCVEALRHKQLPPSLHFESPNPAISFSQTPFQVNKTLKEWKTDGGPRRAGVSSLGVGGTNAHVILEEAPEPPPSSPGKPWKLFTLSARSEAALDSAAQRLREHLERNPGLNLADVAWTLQRGRKGFQHRRVFTAMDSSEACALLANPDKKRVFSGQSADSDPTVTFLFPGGGAQYPDMGLELYREEPAYRSEVDRCLDIILRCHSIDLRSLLFPRPGSGEAAAQELEKPSRSILSVFTVEYALAKLWMSWGIEPAAMTGHSLGEYTAACLAGVFSLEDALYIVALRGEIFDRVPAGTMLSVPLAEAELRPLLGEELSIAAVNAPSLCVASGSVDAIAALAKLLEGKRIEARRVHIAIAAHSHLLDPFLTEFASRLNRVRFKTPERPFISNLTGTWARAEDVASAQYWVRHLRSTVRFSNGLEELLKKPNRIFLEVGPGTTLSSLTRLNLPPGTPNVVLSSLRHPQEAVSDLSFAYTALGRLWLTGHDIDWSKLHGGEMRQRVSLPTYPFEHQRYWLDAGELKAVAPSRPAQREPKKLANLKDWFSVPLWRKSGQRALSDASWKTKSLWLVFACRSALGEEVLSTLSASGQDVVIVEPGARFSRQSERSYTVNVRDPASYQALVEALARSDKFPERVLHLWLTGDQDNLPAGLNRLEEALHLGFWSLFFLAQALGAEDVSSHMTVDVVVTGAVQVNQGTVTHPEHATIIGPVRVIPREMPGVSCRLIDVGESAQRQVAASVLAEALTDSRDAVVAIREAEAWTQSFEPASIGEAPEKPLRLRSRGVYLITGGFGGIGWKIAEDLAKSLEARLILVGRNAPPEDDRRILALKALGAEVLGIAADVTDLESMHRVVASALKRFGVIHGVFHAAGCIEDAPVQLKTVESAERVLRPKVRGTLVLDLALEKARPELFVLFSSTSATLGLPGQIDYAAANAFLNAFARSRNSRGVGLTVAVQWGLWQQVGMAARALGASDAAETSEPVLVDGGSAHPLLGTGVVAPGGESVFHVQYDPRTHWILDEHRLKTGTAIVPGTGYIEICRAAAECVLGSGPIEIRDLVFLAPLEVADGERKDVRISLRAGAGAHAFSVSTAQGEHVNASAVTLEKPAPRAVKIAEIEGRLDDRIEHFGERKETRQERHLRFGARWKNLECVQYGRGEALGRLKLSESFHDDLGIFKAHPAILDLATACGLPLLEGYSSSEGLYVPFSYKKIRIFRPLTANLLAHVRCAGEANTSGDFALFDITILDEEGTVLQEIEEFMLRKVSPAALEKVSSSTSRAAGPRSQGPLDSWLREGILPGEGVRALQRVLEAGIAPEVVISSMPVDDLAAAVERLFGKREARGGSSGSAPAGAKGKEEPADDTERAIAKMWEELLGVSSVGVNDDFFELGGHSLIAVRLVARMEKVFKVKLPLATLFETRTIRNLSGLVRGSSPPAATGSSLVLARPKGSKPPFFCVHGIGGEVLGFAELLAGLDPGQPFLAFRAQGHDGTKAPLATVEEQAALYLKEMRAFQPEGPYAVGGYSLGGWVAFEMARQLEAAGQKVSLLALIDSWPRQVTVSPVSGIGKWLRNAPRWFAEDVRNVGPTNSPGRGLRRMAGVLSKEWRHWVATKKGVTSWRDMPGLPPDLHPEELSESILRTYEANFAAFIKYQPRPWPGSATLFRAQAQPLFGCQEPDLGWRQWAQAGVTVEEVPGNHSSAMREPNVRTLARKLQAALDKAHAESSRPAPELSPVSRESYRVRQSSLLRG